jgi:hypothetical protein
MASADSEDACPSSLLYAQARRPAATSSGGIWVSSLHCPLWLPSALPLSALAGRDWEPAALCAAVKPAMTAWGVERHPVVPRSWPQWVALQ